MTVLGRKPMRKKGLQKHEWEKSKCGFENRSRSGVRGERIKTAPPRQIKNPKHSNGGLKNRAPGK